MAFRVVLQPQALQDIDETTLYIAAQGSLQQARRWREGVFDRIEELADMPTSHARAPESDDFQIELRQFHYYSHRVIFRIENNSVEVLRVYHSARQSFDAADLL